MKKTKRLWSWALAGAMAVSNLGALAFPITAFAASGDFIVVDSLTDGEATAAADNALNAAIGKDYTATLELTEDTTQSFVTTGTLDRTKITMEVLPSAYKDCISLDTSEAVLVNGVASTTSFSISGLKLNVYGSKTANLTTNDTITATIKYSGSLGSGTGTNLIAKGADYTINFQSDTAVTIADVDNLIFVDTDDDGNYIEANGYKKTVTTGVSNQSVMKLGLKSNGINPLSTTSGLVSTRSTGDQVVVTWSTSDPSIIKVNSTTAADPDDQTFDFVSAGAADIIATYKVYPSGETNPTKTGTIKQTVTLEAGAGQVDIHEVDANGLTGTALSAKQVLDKNKTSENLKAVVYSGAGTNTSGFVPGQKVEFISSDEKLVTVSKTSDNAATITGIGNTKTAGIDIYAIFTDGSTYKAYQKATTDTAKLKVLADAVTAGATDIKSLKVQVSDVAKQLIVSESSLDIIAGKEDTSLSVKTNDDNDVGAETPGANAIVYSIKSGDDGIATAKITTAGDITVKGIKAGKTDLTVTGVYKPAGSDNVTLTETISINVVDPNAQEDAKKDAIDAAEKAADKAVSSPTAENIQAAKDAVAAAKAAGATADELKAATDKIAKAEDAKAKADEEAKKAEEEQKKQEEAKKAAETAADGSKANVPAPVNTELKDAAGKATGFKVTDATAGQPTVEFVAPADKDAKNVTVPDTIKDLSGNEYKVTSIASGAFKDSKAKTVTIGKNIKSIDKNAFKDSDIKTVKVKGTKLTKKMAKAFNKLEEGAKIKVSGKNKKKNKKYLNALKNVKNGKIKVK